MTLDEDHYLHLLFVAITCGKVSLWLWKSLENSGNFFLLLCGHPVTVFLFLLPDVQFIELLVMSSVVKTDMSVLPLWIDTY